MNFDNLFRRTYIPIVFLVALFSVLTLNAEETDSKFENCGLTFRAHNYNYDERTGLDLSPGSSFKFNSGFQLEFDLVLKQEDLTFGYVFRIVSDDFESIDLVTHFNSRRANFIFSRGDELLDNIDFSQAVNFAESNWMKIKVMVCADSIKCSVDTIEKIIPFSFSRMKNIRVLFGKNDSNRYFTTDVPPMSVRNIMLKGNEKEMPAYFWELYRHDGDYVYDSVRGKKATASNGDWEIDWHTQWRKLVEIKTSDTCPQVSYYENKVYVSDRDSVKVYDISTGLQIKSKIAKGLPYRNGGSQLIYNHIDSTLFSYSLSSDSFVKYDFDSNIWSDGKPEIWPPVQNSSRVVDCETDHLYIFGGYGNHTYNSDLIIYDLKSDERKKVRLEGVTPRYLSSIGVYGSKMYILGGFGSVSGKQEEFPKNMYDLFVLDLNNNSIISKKDFESEEEPLVFCNSLVYDGNTFFTLGFDNSRFMSELMLISFSLDEDNGRFRIWPDRIPFRFHDTESFSDLVLDKKNNCFYAIVQNAKGTETNEVEVYELLYPPLDQESVIQIADIGKPVIFYAVIILGLLCVCIVLIIVFLFVRKTNRKSNVVSVEDQEPEPQYESINSEDSGYCISLLGDFSVRGLNGDDITVLMSPVVRQIFLIVLLRNADGKGVSSQMLDETFWPDMERVRAANNRNVNIRKLRLLLPKIGDITLVCSNSLWNLNKGSQVTCDYIEMKALLKSFSETENLDSSLIHKILLLAENGPLLPNVEYEWLDVFKSKYTDILIDVLTKISRIPKYSADDKIMSKIAKVLLMHDSIDENAVRLLCKILHKQGHNGQAKQVYDKFCSDYRTLLGENAGMSFDEFLEK